MSAAVSIIRNDGDGGRLWFYGGGVHTWKASSEETGGTLMLAMAGITGRPGTEEDQPAGGPRTDAANYTIGLAQRGVRSSVVRLAPMVDRHRRSHKSTAARRISGVRWSLAISEVKKRLGKPMSAKAEW